MQHNLKHHDMPAKGEDEQHLPATAKHYLDLRESFFTNHSSVQAAEGYCRNWPDVLFKPLTPVQSRCKVHQDFMILFLF